MQPHINDILENAKICEMNDTRSIITDRMGEWANQNVRLAWEGNCDGDTISLTPDEVEILFEHRLTRNVFLNECRKMYMSWVYDDIRTFPGAIVCGIMAPTTIKEIRKEFVDYAKKMGYITDEMTPVVMKTGTKSLMFNSDDTYNIYFEWDDNILEKINREFLEKFTKNYFSGYNIEIKDNGILMKNLLENEVFSRKNIDLFRIYDIQVLCLYPEIDKLLLLRALMQRAFIYLPCNTLRRNQFQKVGSINIPENKKKQINFNEYNNSAMICGKAYYSKHAEAFFEYGYKFNTYLEYIRELFVNAEKILKEKYKENEDIIVRFSPFSQEFYIIYKGEDEEIMSDIQRELITLDYAMAILKYENEFNSPQFHNSIISLLEADSSGIYQKEYISYLNTLKRILPEKCDFM